MKKQMIQKLLTNAAAFLVCALFTGTLPLPGGDEENSILIELPTLEDEEEGICTPLNDSDPWGNPND